MTAVRKPAVQYVGFCVAAGLLAAIWTTATTAQEASKKFIMHSAPKPVAAVQFEDAEGRPRQLTDFRGKVVLLNIWATWCVPCRKEMPALDHLQATLGGLNFEIVTLSIDRAGMDVVRKFFAEVGIHNLTMYRDNAGKASRELSVVGLPTTLLVDREGREIGRLIGPAEWDAPEMVEFIRCVISGGETAQVRKDSNAAAMPPCGGHSLDLPVGGTPTHRQP